MIFFWNVTRYRNEEVQRPKQQQPEEGKEKSQKERNEVHKRKDKSSEHRKKKHNKVADNYTYGYIIIIMAAAPIANMLFAVDFIVLSVYCLYNTYKT